MKELLITIAQGLVEDPSAVTVEQDEPMEDGTVVFHLHVAADDMGSSCSTVTAEGSSTKPWAMVIRSSFISILL